MAFGSSQWLMYLSWHRTSTPSLCVSHSTYRPSMLLGRPPGPPFPHKDSPVGRVWWGRPHPTLLEQHLFDTAVGDVLNKLFLPAGAKQADGEFDNNMIRFKASIVAVR